MKWLVLCLAARVFYFCISVESPWKVIIFDFRHFINPERYGQDKQTVKFMSMIEDLTSRESELMAFVESVDGSIEERYQKLKGNGIFEAYREVHSLYAENCSRGDLESLKRGLFIQWYSVTEPSCYTGIGELFYDAERGILTQLRALVFSSKLDAELSWMLNYYIEVGEFAFSRFNEYTGIREVMQNISNVNYPMTIIKDSMLNRGQLGIYWTSVFHLR